MSKQKRTTKPRKPPAIPSPQQAEIEPEVVFQAISDYLASKDALRRLNGDARLRCALNHLVTTCYAPMAPADRCERIAAILEMVALDERRLISRHFDQTLAFLDGWRTGGTLRQQGEARS